MSNVDEKLWNYIADLAVKYIEDKERTSELRGRYLDVMADKRWANRNFENLVNSICESLDNLERKCAQRGDRDEDWFGDAVMLMVDGHFANSVIADRDAADALSEREYNGMLDALDDYKDMLGTGRSRGGRGSERSGGGFGGGGGREERSAPRGRGGRESPRSAAPASRSGRNDNRSAPTAPGDHWAALSGLGDDHEPEPQRARVVEPEVRYQAEKAIQQATDPLADIKAVEIHVNGPDYTKPRPFDRFWRNDEQWELAHLSKWKLTGDGVNYETMVPALYDCNAFIKYFVMDDEGNVREELEEVTEETRYAQHEGLNRSVDQPVAPKAASAGFSRQQLLNGNSEARDPLPFTEEAPPKLVDLINDIDSTQLELQNSTPVDSLLGATFSSRAKLKAADTSVQVDLHLLRTPIVASSFDQLELIHQIYNTNTLAGAQLKLNELKPQFDLPVWEVLNKRFTDYLMRALKFQFQYDGVTQFNFSKHYDLVLKQITKDRGAEFTAQFAERIGFVTSLACGHFAQSDVAGYTEDLFEHEVYASKNIIVPVVCFVDFIALTAFDTTLDALGIGKQLDSSPMGLVVNLTQHRELNGALRKLYQNLDKALPAPAKVRTYLSTSDNRLVEVLPYANRMETFILAEVQ